MIPVYVLIVFGKRRTEEVAALGVCHELEIVAWRVPVARPQCVSSVFSCWPRGHPAVLVGVVRRIVMQILASQRAVVSSDLLQGINHRWIALKWHSLVQAVFENARDERALVRFR